MNPFSTMCENYPALCQLDKWTLFLEPGIWSFLFSGLLVTLRIAIVALLFSTVFGTLFAMGRMSNVSAIRIPATAFIEIVRALPVILLIFFTFFGAAKLRIGLSPVDAATAALALYTTAVYAEIIRAGIRSIDAGQREAARSLGLSFVQMMRFVVLPQALRRMVAPLLGQTITLIKDTSLVTVLGVNELVAHGQIIYAGSFNPLQTLFVIAMIFFVINYSLSLIVRRLEPARLATA